MENLYQLRSKFERRINSYFPVDGPHDTHGYVVKSEPKLDPYGKRYFLNLVRGTGHGADARERANG